VLAADIRRFRPGRSIENLIDLTAGY